MNPNRRTALTAALTGAATVAALLLPGSVAVAQPRDAGRAAGMEQMMQGPAMERMMQSQGRGMATMMERSPAMQRMHAQMGEMQMTGMSS